jgi:serine/threonine protein kinase
MPALLDEDLADQPSLAPGQTVGSYTIVREIGRGGMGRVFLATDARLGRTVALKAVAPALAGSPTQRERLRREARAAAALTHPGICTIYALEEIDGEAYIASEYVDGHTLRDEIGSMQVGNSGRRPSAQDVSDTARALAAALASAHAKGVIHRDLKPENVMRTADGRLKILDFGLARLSSDSSTPPGASNPQVTLPGMLVGTPAYMAPEQLKGDTVDARADVFALGVLLYEYATGTHPFEASTAIARVARVLDADPRPLGLVRVDLPAPVAAAIDRSLRKAPEQRFASAVDLAAALDGDPAAASTHAVSAWWRTHQIIAIALYLVASTTAWFAKEWLHGIADPIFVLIGVLATAAGVFRGHLMFTERMNRGAFAAERRRAEPITLAADMMMALVLGVDGLLLARGRAVAGVLTIALAVGMALARLVVERSTSNAAFGDAT